MSDVKLSPPGFDAKAMTDNQTTPPLSPATLKGKDEAAVAKAAQDFEAVFLNEMLQHMWQGVEVDKTFGGGHAEEMFRGMMIEEQAKIIAKNGGIGIADAIKKEMMAMQEKAGANPLHRRLGSTAPGNATTGDAMAGAATAATPGNAYAQAQAKLAQHMPLETETAPQALLSGGTDGTTDETP